MKRQHFDITFYEVLGMSDPLIERAFSTQDGLVGCRVYWDGAKWV